MRLVIVESPYAAPTPQGRKDNINYLRRALRDCLLRGEAPFASHAIYTQHGVLDDEVPAERTLGIMAGLEWGDQAEATVVYVDRGVSKGMRMGIQRAEAAGRPVEERRLDPAPAGMLVQQGLNADEIADEMIRQQAEITEGLMAHAKRMDKEAKQIHAQVHTSLIADQRAEIAALRKQEFQLRKTIQEMCDAKIAAKIKDAAERPLDVHDFRAKARQVCISLNLPPEDEDTIVDAFADLLANRRVSGG